MLAGRALRNGRASPHFDLRCRGPVKLDSGKNQSCGSSIYHRAETQTLGRPVFGAHAKNAMAQQCQRRAVNGQLSLADKDPRAAKPGAVVPIVTGKGVPLCWIVESFRARVTLTDEPARAVKCFHHHVVVAGEL